MSAAASRKAGGSSSAADADRVVSDRSQYIAFLEQQLERVSAACQNVQLMDEKLDHLKQTQNTYEAKISNLAKLVKLDKMHTSKIKTDTAEYADTLKKRLQFSEQQSRQQFDKLQEQMSRLESMYAAFPTDAAAISAAGGAQPQGLPGFIATYIHSLFAQHTQSTSAALTTQAQTHQIHLQNWVQEYIKTTHPSSKLLEEVNSFKLELHSLTSKMGDGEARLVSLIDKRMSGYTEIYSTMEERFLNVVDVHHRKLSEQISAYDARIDEIQRVLESTAATASAAHTQSSALESSLSSQKESTANFLSLVDEMKTKLDTGIADFNANINNLVLELREKTWHAEQTCSRLAVDTISRQNVFSKKIEAQLAVSSDALNQQISAHISAHTEASDQLRQQVAAFERKIEKATKKSENRIQILANTLRDKFDKDEENAQPSSASNTGGGSAAYSPRAVHKQITHLDGFTANVDSRLAALRSEIAAHDTELRAQCAQDAQSLIAEASRELHLKIDKQIEDKIYMIERAQAASQLSRKSSALAGSAAQLSDAASHSLPAHELRSLRSDLNAEIKRNLSAMHVLLEEKLQSVERKSATNSLEYSRSIGETLRDLEAKSNAAEQYLQKAQALYNSMLQQSQGGAPAATAAALSPRPSSSRQQPHRPASPTLYPASNFVPAPPAPAPAPPAPPRDPQADGKFPAPHFASTLPFYHDPKDPLAPYLAHSSLSHGAYVPPARLGGAASPSRIHQYDSGAGSREEVVRQAEVRRAADAALDRALSPLRRSSRSPSPPSLLARFNPNNTGVAAVHHHTASDDLYLPNRATSKPYALIPSHFLPAERASSFFDRARSSSRSRSRSPAGADGGSGGAGGGGSRGGGGDGAGGGRGPSALVGVSGFGSSGSGLGSGLGRSLDDSDLVVHDRAIASGLGNIDQLLRSMEFMDSVESKQKKGGTATTKRGQYQTPQLRAAGFCALALFPLLSIPLSPVFSLCVQLPKACP